MKKLFFTAAALVLLCATSVSAQIKNQEFEKYRRSSLSVIMLEDPNLDPAIASLVKESFLNNPLPSKYNDHGLDVSLRTFSFGDVTITDEDKAAYNAFIGKKEQGALASAIAGAAKEAFAQILKFDKLKEDAPYVAYKYVMNNNLAKKSVDRWFGVDGGKFNLDLLRERVAWNATELEKAAAAEASTGRSAIDYIFDNGGEEIVSNTFIPVVRFRYMSADELAAEVEAYAQIAASLIPIPQAQQAAMLAAKAAGLAISKIGGYFVHTTTYLYRLKWNADVFNAISQTGGDLAKYNALNCFELEFVGDEKAFCSVTAVKRTQEEAVKFATVRAMDKVFAKLEKKYEVFRTKTPLATVTPAMTAYIGTKECVEKGDKYEILIRSIDPKTNKETYKSVGKIAVETVGNNMGDNNDEKNASADPFTTFKGKAPKKATSGMLIRQL
jgi:hypothetical protein